MRALCSSFLLLIGSLAAQEEIAKTSFPVRLTPEEEAGQCNVDVPCCPPEPTCKPKCCTPYNHCPGIVFEKSCYNPGPYFFADWLYWRTRQDGMQFATSYNPFAGDLLDARTKSFNFSWQTGWRVGARYDSDFDYWDLDFAYSSINPHATGNASGLLFPYLLYQGNVNSTDLVQQAFGTWKISFNTWNLAFGKKMIPSEHFIFRPHAGIKQAWIHQKAKIHYRELNTGAFDIKIKDRFNGFGLRGGFDSTWPIGVGFSVIGNLAASMLWGSFHAEQTQTILGFSSIDWKDKFNAIRPMIEAMLGFSWDWRYYHDRFLVGVDASFEMQYWWNQNVYERFTSAFEPTSVKSEYDLAFYGLTFGVKLGF